MPALIAKLGKNHSPIYREHASFNSLVLITTLYVRCHHQLRMIPERSLFLLHVYVPINFGKDPPSLVISSTKITKWVRGDVASSTTRACCRSPVAFLAQSNEESDVWWGVRGKSEYDEGFPKQLARCHTYCGETLQMEMKNAGLLLKN